MFGCAERGIESWTRGIDQGAILVVCHENYQWRQVGKCADDRLHGSYKWIQPTETVEVYLTGDNLPTCVCQLETTEGSNQKNGTVLVFKRVGLGFSKDLSTSCRSFDLIPTERNGLSVLLFYGIHIDSGAT